MMEAPSGVLWHGHSDNPTPDFIGNRRRAMIERR